MDYLDGIGHTRASPLSVRSCSMSMRETTGERTLVRFIDYRIHNMLSVDSCMLDNMCNADTTNTKNPGGSGMRFGSDFGFPHMRQHSRRCQYLGIKKGITGTHTSDDSIYGRE